MDDLDRGIPCTQTYTKEVCDHVLERRGMEINPRTVEDALRKNKLRTYRPGQKRYTTPRLIDAWLESCLTPASERP